MARLMCYDAREHEWRPMKLSEVLRYKNTKFYINNKWIPIEELVEDDINETENSDER